jgi:uncharacterized repeat protein (TIGR02543 family)
MNKPRLWAALFTALLFCAGCKDFFHPEGPTKVPGPYPLTDEQAADAFREIETVKETLEINVAAIDLDVPAEDLAALETKVDEALAAYDELSQGARSALSTEKARLDAIKEKIGHVHTAHNFRDDHTVILAKSPEELATTEEAAALLPELERALEAIGALPEGARELLAEDRALLEDLTAKAEELTAPPPLPVQRTLAFDSHGGSELPSVTADEGTAVPKSANPTMDGHSFLGWFDAETGGALYAWPHTLTESITAHARWQEDSLPPPIQYTITFDSHGGSEFPPITANEGTPVTKPANPLRTGGYRFLGWFDAASGGKAYTAWPYTISADVTLHAQWVRLYTIIFDHHEGSELPPITADAGTPVNKPADPAKTGYGFAGWFPTETGGAQYDWSYALSADITMRAHWTAIAYTVAYHSNGGDGTMTPSVHAYDTAKDLADIGFARSGYSFKTWAAAPNGSGAVYADQASVVNLSSADGAAVDLYAQWTAIAYTVQYNANGGETGAMEPSTHTYDAEETLAANGFNRKGYSFKAWAAEPNGSGAVYADQASVVNLSSTSGAVVDLYAQWTAIAYKITYVLGDGGSNHADNPKTYTVEDETIPLKDPAHATRKFQDWYTDPGFNEADVVTAIPAGSAGEQTFYARWKPPASIAITLQSLVDPSLTGTTTLSMD